MITGIILAAGESKRMGRPKALLRIGKQTFIRRIIAALNHPAITRIVVVLGAHADDVREEIKDLNVTVVVNHDYLRGQLSSLIVGIAEAERGESSAVIVHPVDHPLVTAGTVHALVESFLVHQPALVLPTFEGKRGHPVIFPSTLFQELKQAPLSIGARAVVRQHRDSVVEVPCPDSGVIRNIDTVADYENLQRALHSAA